MQKDPLPALALVAQSSREHRALHSNLQAEIFNAIRKVFEEMGRTTVEDPDFVEKATDISNNAAAQCYDYHPEWTRDSLGLNEDLLVEDLLTTQPTS